MDNLRNNTIPVTALKINEKARIIEIDSDDTTKIRKLTAFGIVPGFDIILIQKYPAYIIGIGFTQVALDEGIASQIIVEKRF